MVNPIGPLSSACNANWPRYPPTIHHGRHCNSTKPSCSRVGDSWVLPLAEKCEQPQRGFVEKISIGARQLLTNADALFEAAPLTGLKILRMKQTRNAAEDLAKLPHLARLREEERFGEIRYPDRDEYVG
jgi:hypothetical protein